MQAGIRIAMMTSEPIRPCPVWAGWVLTLIVGTLAGAYVGLMTNELANAVVAGSVRRCLLVPFVALAELKPAVPVAFVFGVVPITITYGLVRVLSGWVWMNWWTRLGLGFAFGLFWAGVMFAIDLPTVPEAVPYDFTALWPTCFPEVQIVAGGVAVALIDFRRWFGVMP
jgi:hypothetical protein